MDDKILTLLQELRDIYEPEGCGIWLYSKHDQFGGLNAIEMIEQGRIDELLQITDQLRSGAYG